MNSDQVVLLRKAQSLAASGRARESLQAYREFLDREPGHADSWADYASQLLQFGDMTSAKKACERALELDHHHSVAQIILGHIHLQCDQPRDAVRLFQRVLAREEKRFDIHARIAGMYSSFGCWRELQKEIQRFRQIDPTSAYLEYQQSFLDLRFGNWLKGWERYEARLRIPKEQRTQRSFEVPAWTGEAFSGRTLLLWPEQGLGDTLMFLRYIPMVKALGGQVMVEVQAPLLDVAATCPGIDAVVPRYCSSGIPFDCQQSLASLPWVFKTDLRSVPSNIPYLGVPTNVPHRVEIDKCLAEAGENTRIGLVWSGNPRHARNEARSIPATSLAPLAAIPGVSWFGLQLECKDEPPLPNFTMMGPMLGSFSDTAYVLSCLDLVISVDTSVAHLAGAMGIPTLVLLALQADFRWMEDRSDTPWYPTMHLYRQPTRGDWNSVIQTLTSDLTQSS